MSDARPLLRGCLAAAVAAMCALVGAPAAACVDAATPCAIDGGVYHVAAPEAPPRGVIAFLHGWGGRAAAQIGQARVVAPWLAAGYVVVAPQGEPRRPGDRGGAWNSRATPQRRDDVAFVQATVADARARFGAGAGPTLIGGFSGGGMMAWRIACDAPRAADAFLPVAGLLWRPLPDRCAGPARMLHTHGWADPVVPLEGRAVAGGALVQGDLFAGLGLMRRSAGCARDLPDAFDAPAPFLRRHWTGCAEGAAFTLAMWPGGHATPPAWADMAIQWVDALEL